MNSKIEILKRIAAAHAPQYPYPDLNFPRQKFANAQIQFQEAAANAGCQTVLLHPQDDPNRLIRELHMPLCTERPRKWPEDGGIPLVATGPYDELYVFYAVAMIEFYQREYGNYNNSMIQFNDRCADFRRAYRRGHPYRPQRTYEGVF